MKKIGCLVLAFLLICLSGCGNGQDSDTEPAGQDDVVSTETPVQQICREMEAAYMNEVVLPEYSSTAGRAELAQRYVEKWSLIAQEYYQKLMEYNGIVQLDETHYSSEDFQTFIRNMKTNWEQYNQVQCENYLKVLQAVYGSGTIVAPLMAEYECEMQKDWALQLVGIYQQLPL